MSEPSNQISNAWGFAALALLFFAGVTFGCFFGYDQAKKDAAKAGHAQWIVNEYGSPEFQWKEIKP